VASVHLDFWNVQPNSAGIMDDPLYVPLWRFLNRYSGEFPSDKTLNRLFFSPDKTIN
jgi:hypothetical protein